LLSNHTVPKVVRQLLDKQLDNYKAAYKIYNDSVSSSSRKDQAKADMKAILDNFTGTHGKEIDTDFIKIPDKSATEEKKWWYVFKNQDGTYSLYDNIRNDFIKKRFHEQAFVFEVSAPSFFSKEISKPSESGNAFGFPSVSFKLLTGGWELENIDLSLLDFVTAELAAELNTKTGIEFAAMVSIWTPSIAFSIGKLDVEVGFNVGSAGIVVKILDFINPLENFKLGASGGFGLTISLSEKEKQK
jgi:hypothetical protein